MNISLSRRRLGAVAAAATGLVLVGGVAVVHAATTSNPTASCTSAPTVTQVKAGSEISVTCTVPNPPAATVTATATATTTVTASPDPSPSSPTSSAPTAPSSPTSSSTTPSSPSSSTTTSAPPSAGTSTTGFPNANSTGVPAGTTLTAYNGPMTITTPGTVVDGKSITGDLRIKAANVVVKNSHVYGDVRIDAGDSGYSFTIEDSTVDAGPTDGSAAYDGTGIGARDFTALRVNVIHGKRSINCFLNCTVQDSYLHGQANPGADNAHESAVRMGDGSTIVHNTLACEGLNNAADGGCSADLTGYGDFAVVQNDLIQNNLFKAQLTGGGTCAYGGSSAGKPYSAGANHIRFLGNTFERGTNKSDHGLYVCGYYASSMDFDASAPGNQWSGNTYDDGTPVGPNSNK